MVVAIIALGALRSDKYFIHSRVPLEDHGGPGSVLVEVEDSETVDCDPDFEQQPVTGLD
jgi:hypothetical protein